MATELESAYTAARAAYAAAYRAWAAGPTAARSLALYRAGTRLRVAAYAAGREVRLPHGTARYAGTAPAADLA